MREPQAKRILKTMLRKFTPGSILHLLADHFREQAEQASQIEDALAYERCKTVECTLIVVGMGIDAACPR